MDIFAPTYYTAFKCIADRCRHNCCIGWEIDVDNETLGFYKACDDIIDKIDLTDAPHFKQGKDGRCPFLNKHNLCDIILTHGEERLCQICRDHPRFRTFFDSRTEIGLGLTCEAAAELILNSDFSLQRIGNDAEPSIESVEEQDFFEFRNGIFSRSPSDFRLLLPCIRVSELAEIFKGLERLDTAWDDMLASLNDRCELISETVLEQGAATRLFHYFVLRHLHNYGLDFCVLCTYFVMCFDQDIYEVARMFSSEIEYSDQNINNLIEQVFG